MTLEQKNTQFLKSPVTKQEAILIAQKFGNANSNDKGYFIDQTALEAAYPVGEAGWYAIIGSTDTIWVWDTEIEAWINSGTMGSVSSVFGRTGAVGAESNDYSADQIESATFDVITANNVQDALEQLYDQIPSIANLVPYDGADSNVDIGRYSLIAGSLYIKAAEAEDTSVTLHALLSNDTQIASIEFKDDGSSNFSGSVSALDIILGDTQSPSAISNYSSSVTTVNDGTRGNLISYSYGGTSFSQDVHIKTRGTINAPEDVQNGDTLYSLQSWGIVGENLDGGATEIRSVISQPEGVSSSAAGTKLELYVTEADSISELTKVLTLDSDLSATFTGAIASEILNELQLVATDADKKLQTLNTDDYPSITEISHVKGVTSNIQDQINTIQNGFVESFEDINSFTVTHNLGRRATAIQVFDSDWNIMQVGIDNSELDSFTIYCDPTITITGFVKYL